MALYPFVTRCMLQTTGRLYPTTSQLFGGYAAAKPSPSTKLAPKQDAVMQQFFGLINTLLAATPAAAARCLGMGTYRVVPISPAAGGSGAGWPAGWLGWHGPSSCSCLCNASVDRPACRRQSTIQPFNQPTQPNPTNQLSQNSLNAKPTPRPGPVGGEHSADGGLPGRAHPAERRARAVGARSEGGSGLDGGLIGGALARAPSRAPGRAPLAFK